MNSDSDISVLEKPPSESNSISFESSSVDDEKQSKATSGKKNTPSKPKLN